MRLARYKQQPRENKRYCIGYTSWLATAETLTNLQVIVSPTTSPVLAITDAVIDPDGKNVIFFAGGGVDGTEYTVEILATTSEGQVKEDEVLFAIEEVE